MEQTNFHRLLNFLYFLLGNSPAPEFYMPTFRNTLSVPSSQAGILHTYPPMMMEQTECYETLAYKIQTPGITHKKPYNIHDFYF